MEPVSDLRTREAETYLAVVAERGLDVGVSGFAVHTLATYDDADFATLADVLDGAGASASFAFLGRDAEAQAETIARLDADGHEVVCHGQRHVACDDLTDALARENVEGALATIEEAAGVRPSAFFAPLLEMNATTMAVLADAGIDHAVGRAVSMPPAGLTVVEPEPLVDLELLMESHSPEETFEALGERAESGGVFLMHPTLIEHYGAAAEFEAWIDEYRPVSVGEWVEAGGVGLLVDAVRPLKIE